MRVKDILFSLMLVLMVLIQSFEVISLELPKPDSSGCFIPTLNNMGYATTRLDPFSQEFVQYASLQEAPVLEVGAAYGLVTLAALSQGAKIISNDIEPQHLMLIQQQAVERGLNMANLETLPGDFSYEIKLQDNSLAAILIGRVLFAFDGPRIEHSFRKAFQSLKPGGKLFIVADTPYLKIAASFIPEYETRVKKGEKWPGLITNLQTLFKDPNLPKIVHALDAVVLKRELEAQGFIIEKIAYLNRLDFPPERRLDGRESVGVIAVKPQL